MDTIFVEKISFLKYFHTVKKKDEINIKVVAEVQIISFSLSPIIDIAK